MNWDWPTPAVFDTTGGPYPTELTPEGFRSYHNGVPHGTKLSDAVRVEPTRDWPTPTKQDGENNAGPSQFDRNSLPLNTAVIAYSGPPRTASGPPAPDSGSTGGSRQESWATPSASEGTGAGEGPNKTGGPNLRTQTGGKLNPSWVETLMGFPVSWTQLPTKFVKPKGAK